MHQLQPTSSQLLQGRGTQPAAQPPLHLWRSALISHSHGLPHLPPKRRRSETKADRPAPSICVARAASDGDA